MGAPCSFRLSFALSLALIAAADVRAQPEPMRTDASRDAIGSGLARRKADHQRPRYSLDVTLTDCCAHVRQTVQWTNRAATATHELVFHVYPRHRPDKQQLYIYSRTMESLRVDPKTAIDAEGRRITVRSIRSGNVPSAHGFDPACDTHLHVRLPAPVRPGETVEVVLDYSLDIPPVQGRFGRSGGVTNLLNWYPVLAVFGDAGWDAPPYVAWHQPWLVEAADYTVRLTLPAARQVAASGRVVEHRVDQQGRQHLLLEGSGLRDFALVVGDRYELHETTVEGINVRVLAFPEHQFHARTILHSAAECVRQYQHWFGPYAYPELTIVESHFGWNGNESSALVMIDARVFAAPTTAALYVDSLASHEICHQWWYSAVGVDGYREPWMDEGLVSYLTQWRIRQKYGPDPGAFDHPPELQWLPNICYRTLLLQGYLKYRRMGGTGVTQSTLDELVHLQNTFDLAYTRGSQIVGMIHHRIGSEDFFGVLRRIYARYRFGILRTADFQRELEQYTGRSWEGFFSAWLRTAGIADWAVHDVQIEECPLGYRTTVRVIQREEIDEPVAVGYRHTVRGPIVDRVLLDPERGEIRQGSTWVARAGAHEWLVTFYSDQPPAQVEIDPDRWVLDAHLENNRWRAEPAIRFTPLYTPLDEVPLTRPIDRLSFVYGPNVDAEGRIGLRGSLMSVNRYRISPFLSFTPEDNNNHLTAGVEAIVHQVPWKQWDLGVRYEHSLASNLFDDPQDQGRVFLRWNRAPATSFIYPNPSTIEFYFRFGDNFFPDEDIRPPINPAVEDYRNIRALGITLHADTRMPYWNPDTGWALDASYEHGFVAFGGGETYNRVWGQVSAVRKLPDGHGYLSHTKLAGRAAGGVGSPDNGEHFRFGGPQRFRGQRSEDTEGSAFWLGSLEWRFPLIDDAGLAVYDNFARLRSVYSAVFYDVGESFLLDRSQGIDHAIGVGLYFDIPLLSFVENLTVRVEYGRSLEQGTEIVWLGWYHAF